MTYTTRVIVPGEGMCLTQAGDVALMEREVGNKVYLAANDSPENWKEITVQEGEEIVNSQREERERVAREMEPEENVTEEENGEPECL